jgi:hypothetical protein
VASPPKCACGLYAIGECVDCDSPLCGDHGIRGEERFRCDKDHRAWEKRAKAALRQTPEYQARAQKRREKREEAERLAALRKATEDRRAAAAEAKALQDSQRAQAAAQAELERKRQAKVASAAEKAARRKWFEAGFTDDETKLWRRHGVRLDDAVAWSALRIDAVGAEQWRTAGATIDDARKQLADGGTLMTYLESRAVRSRKRCPQCGHGLVVGLLHECR